MGDETQGRILAISMLPLSSPGGQKITNKKIFGKQTLKAAV